MYDGELRGNLVRLRTLVQLRWIAIIGQSFAFFIAVWYYDLIVEIGYAAIVIGLSVIANLYSWAVYPESHRLSGREAGFILGFDILQLGSLVMIAGGLNNPFALLILAPVTIAATTLNLGSMVIISALAIALISAAGLYHMPIVVADGSELMLPSFLQFGFWVALVIGVIFIALYARQVTLEMQRMRDALVATQLALTREQQLTDLGGVIAATAHELGTPLATIKLVSGELIDELEAQPDLLADVVLIKEQADRCGDIMHAMSAADKDHVQMRAAPIEAVLHEAAGPHEDRGKKILFLVASDGPQPIVRRQPEIIHGLRNLIQNAVDYAVAEVWIEATWDSEFVTVCVVDDGPGYPSNVLGRIGDPYVQARRDRKDQGDRPGYDGMGLGLFIAKTLLERTGAELVFANWSPDQDGAKTGIQTGGATVTVRWSRQNIEDNNPF